MGEIGVGYCSIFSGDRVYEPNQRLVVSDGVVSFPPRDLERLFLSDGFLYALDCVGRAFELLLQLLHDHPTLRFSRQKEVQRRDGALGVGVLKKIAREAGAVDFLKGGVRKNSATSQFRDLFSLHILGHSSARLFHTPFIRSLNML